MQNYVYMLYGNLYINLTNRCTNDCTFCIRLSGDDVAGTNLRLDKEPTIQDIVDAANNINEKYDEVVFCGYGESTMRLTVLIESAKYFQSIGKVVRLNTNGLGSLFNNHDITYVLKDCIDIVSVSLNDSCAKEYDKISRPQLKGSYVAMLDFTKKCVENNIKTIMTVVDVIGEKKINECRDIVKDIGAEFRVRTYIKDNYNSEQ